MKKSRPVRHWPGMAPEHAPSSSEDEQETTEQPMIPATAQVPSITQQPKEISEESDDEEDERRRELLRLRALRMRQQESDVSDEESERIITKVPVKETIQQKKPPSSSESSEEESSEYESSSESEDDKPILLKPVFVPKNKRDSIKDKETIELEKKLEEERKKVQEQERKKQSHQMVSEEVKRELASVKEKEEVCDVDDRDGIDEEEEFQAWKLRELQRIKRDREEQAARDEEIMEIERRRGMTDAEIMAEDAKNNPEKERTKIKFLQKYYHKGAFFTDLEILQRDYSAPTLEDRVDKSALPAVMQVKNFGKMGRTKWTHLSNEDTSRKDASWNMSSQVNKRMLSKLGGIKSSYESDSKRPRQE